MQGKTLTISDFLTCLQGLWLLLPAIMIALLLQSAAFAESWGTNNLKKNQENREDLIMGTFTEGMELGKDEDGNNILRSEPSPQDEPEQPQSPPIIIDLRPQVTVPGTSN